MKFILVIIISINILLANGGADLYSKCTSCHGQFGEKSALGKSPPIGGHSASKILKQLKKYKAGNLNLYGMGALMKVQVANMSNKDLSLVATYIEQLENALNKDPKISNTDIYSKISLCAEEINDKKRLNCFDRLPKKGKNSQQTEKGASKVISPKIVDKGKWSTKIGTSEIDDSQRIILTLFADNTIYSSYQAERPILMLRCSENKTEAYINWGVFLGSDSANVLIRYDKEKAKKKWWDLSTDHRATFIRGSISFIKKLMKHEKLLVKVTPYSESPVTVTFDVRGLDEVIKPLRKACHW